MTNSEARLLISTESIESICISVTETSTSKTLTLNILPNSLVSSLKSYIQTNLGSPTYPASLLYAGEELDETHTVTQSRLVTNSNVYYFKRPAELWVLFLRHETKATQSIDVNPNDSIMTLYRKAANKRSKKTKEIAVIYQGKVMKNEGKTIQSQRIQNNDLLFTLVLPSNPYKLIVVVQPKVSFTLDVSWSQSLGDLKRQIQLKKEVTEANQRLFFRDTELIDDLKPLSAFNLSDGASIQLITKKPDCVVLICSRPVIQSIYYVQIQTSGTISDIKSELNRVYCFDSSAKLELWHEKSPLDDKKTIADYTLFAESKIELRVVNVLIFRDLGGKLAALQVDLKEKTEKLIEIICEKLRIEPSKQRSTFRGSELIPGKPLEASNLIERSIIELNTFLP